MADVLPGRTFHGQVASLAPATGAVFSVIPPQNATGNFTKIVQRVPVRIMLDGDGQDLGLLRAGLSVIARVDTRPETASAKWHRSRQSSFSRFAVMCVGMFIALLDIQIVASSLATSAAACRPRRMKSAGCRRHT